jgi:hypothetical protein
VNSDHGPLGTYPVFVVLWRDALGGVRAAGDQGQLLCFAWLESARVFASELERQGVDVLGELTRTSEQVAQLCALHGLEPHRVELVEAATEGPADVVRWARELAERVAAQVRGNGPPSA